MQNYTTRLRVHFLPRDAMNSTDVARCLSICLSVCLSVTRLYCAETAKHRIKLISPSGSRAILVFFRTKCCGNSQTETPKRGRHMQMGYE